MSGILSNAVVKDVLLFGVETWVMTPHIGRALGGFQHRVTRHITRKAAPEAIGWELGLPSIGYGNVVIRVLIYEELCTEETEYGRIVHHNETDYVPLQHIIIHIVKPLLLHRHIQ